MNAPLVLLYNLDNRNGSRLRLICLKLHIRVRTVAPAELAEPVRSCVFWELAPVDRARLDEAERIWLGLLADAPADAEWRPMVLERVRMIEQLRSMSRTEPQR